jgi:spore coat protein CotH
MPERFVLEFLTDTGEWLDHSPYDADSFDRGDDGTYMCLDHGSPLYLRCLRQDGSVIYVIDHSGDPFTYRLVPFPGGGYS